MIRRAPETPPSLDVVYSEVKDRIAVQLEQVDALDRKAGAVLTFSSVILAVAAGLRFPSLEDEVPSKIAFLVLFVLGTLLYGATMFFAVRAYSVVRYRRDPEPRPLRDKYLLEDPAFTKRKVLSNLIESFEFNATMLRRKAQDVQRAMRLLFLETILLAGALVLERMLA